MIENIIAKNRVDMSNYIVEKYYTAGLVLFPIEVRVINVSSCSLKGSYVKVINSQSFITNMYIQQTEYRVRNLLLNKKEIIHMFTYLKNGYTIFPEYLFKKNNLLKLKLVVAKYVKNSKKHDKNESYLRSLKQEIKKKTKGICHF